MNMISFIILCLYPVFDMFVHRFMFNLNKGLYLDLFIPKKYRDKLWEVLKNE